MPRDRKLFWNGRGQAVRLPAEFRFEGEEVEIRRDSETGDVVLSQKLRQGASWGDFSAGVSGFLQRSWKASWRIVSRASMSGIIRWHDPALHA